MESYAHIEGPLGCSGLENPTGIETKPWTRNFGGVLSCSGLENPTGIETRDWASGQHGRSLVAADLKTRQGLKPMSLLDAYTGLMELQRT